MTDAVYDLISRNGRLLDPASNLDRPGSLAVADGRIASIDPADDAPATQTVNVAGKVIAPGLLDLHTHVYPAAISVGVDPDEVAAGSATTTVVDAGSAGAGNTLRLRQFVTDAAHMSGCSPS